MMMNLSPALEDIRETGLAAEENKRKSLEQAANEMMTSLSRVHASYLFLTKNESALQKFCVLLDATSSDILNNSWNALAIELGFSHFQVACVRNMNKNDYTYLILKSYATKPDADIGHVIRALKNIERLDAFAALRKHLDELTAQHGGGDVQNEDSGFSSIDTENGNEPSLRLIYPPEYSKIRSRWEEQLPFTLRHLKREDRNLPRNEELVKSVESCRVRHREENRIQGAEAVLSNFTAKVKRMPACKVLLTFAEDGKSLAKSITRTLRTRQEKRPEIGVLTLDEHRNRVEQNPERFIMHWFYKVNYVIPILTEGYMTAICKPSDHHTTDSLDVEYVPYIHDLANKYYKSNGCLNNKIRCVVPKHKRSILNHTHRKLDPIMRSYVYDTEIERLAKRMTGTFDEEDDE